MARKPEPREMPPMTEAQRRANWWHYHWHYLLLGAAALAVLTGVIWEQISQVKPDCSVAVVTRYAPLPEELADLQAALEAVCPDANGDGKIHVAINTIQIDYTASDLDDAAVMVMTANVDKLNADFYTRQSGIFLLDDPASFHASYAALACPDGSAPSGDESDWESVTVPWEECPAVKDVTFSQADRLWFGRRLAETEEERKAFVGAAALWERLFPEQAAD